MGDEWRERDRMNAGADDGAWQEALAGVGRLDEAEGRARLPDGAAIYARAMADAPEEEAALRAAMRRALRPVRWMEWIGAAATAVAIVLAVRWAMRDEVADRLLGLLAESSGFPALIDGLGEVTLATGGGAGSLWPPSFAWPPTAVWTPSVIVVVGVTVAVVAALVTALASPEPTEL